MVVTATPPEVPKKSFFKKFILGMLAFMGVGFLYTVISLIGFGILISVLFGLGSSKAGGFAESVLQEGSEKHRIAVINISGEIVGGSGDGTASTVTSESVIGQLKKASKDNSVKAVILKIDSPGGSVVPSEQIYNSVKAVNKDKKIFVVMGDVAASGGYYIASPAHKIYANRDTLTGSIGVILEIPNVEGLLDIIGVSFTTYKSAEHKDIGSSFRIQDDEEKKILQSIVDQAFQNFKDAVTSGRKLSEADLKIVLDGRVLTGSQAKDLKLIDEIGGFDEAVEAAKKEINLSDVEVFEYSTGGLLNSLGSLGARIDKLLNTDAKTSARLLYRWSPGI